MFPLELLLALIIIASIVLPIWVARHTSAGYDISKANQLLTPTPTDLQAKLTYDSTEASWQFNRNAKSELPGDTGNSLNVGGVTYSANLPRELSKQNDISLTDQPSKQQVAMTPRFTVAPGQQQQGYVVYPLMGQKSQLIYTFQRAGIKEDIVLYKASGDTASYNYQLQLPDGMVARLQPDGSVGIYGGDPSLFGNISYGSSNDQALVAKARANSAKDHLYYVIPAPTITGNGTAMVKAKFLLKGASLTVQVSGLAKAHYPLSIDPSFVMNTTNCGWQAGNSESNATISGCQIKRDGLSGGTVGGWTSADTGTPLGGTGRFNFSSTAYNGYLYVLGGQIYSGGPAQNNDVLYVKLNSNGTLGTWQVGPSFLGQSRVNFASAAHNGYLYIFGGVNSSNAMTNDVQFIKLGSNGAPTGGWQYTSNSTASTSTALGMPVARYGHTATIYNNYVYVVGGCQYSNGGCIKPGNVDGIITTNIVIAAPINGNGTIGAWTATTAPNATGIYNHSAEVYNGYLYIMGGCTKNYVNIGVDTGYCDTSGMQNAVLYAPINAGGSLGAWQTTSSFTTARQNFAATVSDGYLYVLGGCSQGAGCSTGSGFLGDVQVAPIYANGGLGTWQATTSFTTARFGQGAALYNGYAYVFGGCSQTNSSQCVNGNYQADTQYASISKPGVTSGYTTGTYDTTARNSFATVSYGGYVYIIGGTTAQGGGASTMLNTVRYAPINSNGTLGTWTTSGTGFNTTMTGASGFCSTAGNCPGRVNMAAAAYNGYLYIAGGASNGGDTNAAWSDVQAAPLDPTTGAVGTWTTVMDDFIANSTTTYNPANGRSQMSMQIYNGRMYLLGGFNFNPTPNGTDYADIYYSTLGANGSVGNFTHSTVNLPSARSGINSFVQSNRLYIVGGGMGQGWASIANDNDDVQFIPINSDGTLDGTTGWKNANAAVNGGSGSSFVAAGGLQDYGVAISNDYLYITGGNNGTSGPANTFGAVYKARLNTDGSLGNWTTVSSLLQSRYGADSIAANGYLYSFGGCSQKGSLIGSNCTNIASMLSSFEYAQIYNGGGGLPNSWSTSATTMSIGRFRHRTVAMNGYIYAISGCSSWSTLSNGCSGLTGTVAYAPVDASTGNVGTWLSTTAGVTAREFFGAFTYGGYIYLLGGCTNPNCGTQTTTIQYGKPNAAGDVTTWATNPASLPAGWGPYTNAVVTNNTAYVFNLTNSAYATIDPSTHQISGSWTSGPAAPMSYDTAALEVVTNGKYIYQIGGYSGGKSVDKIFYVAINGDGSLGSWRTGRSLDAGRHDSFVAAIYNGYLYVAGGFNVGSAYATNTDSQYASINADGSLGPWQEGAHLPIARTATSGIAYNGYLYAVGGIDSGSIRNTLDWSPLQSMAAIGRYSIMLQTDQPTMPVNFFTNISPQSGSSAISIGFAGATTAAPGFGIPSTTTSPTNGTKYPLAIAGDGVSYYWLPITIDDSQSFTFGETSQSNVGYFQLNYHPNPGMRLRGGKTFNSQQLQSLDAP